MSTHKGHKKSPVCWTLTQGSAGMQGQVVGLAEALGYPVVTKISERRYPWRILWAGFQWHALRQLTPQSDPLIPPWPDILIACGRGSVPLALAIRKESGGKTFCVYIQDPQVNPVYFDVVVAPLHDDLTGPNVIQTDGALHRLTSAKLKQAHDHFAPRFASFSSPLSAVLIGGSGNHYTLTHARLCTLVKTLDRILATVPGTLLITPSRRTGEENIAFIKDHFKNTPRVYVADLNVDNPYLGMLAVADTIFVTEDSVSMITEACFTGKPVYILTLEGHYRRKAKGFIERLKSRGMVRYFENQVESWTYPPLDETHRVAEIIKAKFEEHLERIGSALA